MHALLAEKSASPVAALRSPMWHCGVLGVSVEILIRFMQMPLRRCVWLPCIHLLLVLDILISSNTGCSNFDDVACLPKTSVAFNFCHQIQPF